MNSIESESSFVCLLNNENHICPLYRINGREDFCVLEFFIYSRQVNSTQKFLLMKVMERKINFSFDY